MSLVLTSTTNPGTATWAEATAAAAQNVAFLLSDGYVTPYASTTYYTATGGTQIDVSFAPPVFAGQIITILMTARSGADNTVVTFPLALNPAGNTIVTFDAVNDSFGAIAVASGLTALKWVPLFNNGCTLS